MYSLPQMLPHPWWPLVTLFLSVGRGELRPAVSLDLAGEGEVLGALGGSEQTSQGWLPSGGRAGQGHGPWALGTQRPEKQGKD